MSLNSVPVTLAIFDSQRPPVPAVVDVVVLTGRERAKKAAKRLGLLWAIALACLAIPVLHFILVPSLLLAGPVAAAFAFRSRVRLEAGTRLPCPKCGAEFSLTERGFGWPFKVSCGECGTRFSVKPAR